MLKFFSFVAILWLFVAPVQSFAVMVEESEDVELQKDVEREIEADKTQDKKAPPAKDEVKNSVLNYDRVTLQAINKITARSSSTEARLDNPLKFGTLEIILHKCVQTITGDKQENAALLEIYETKPKEPPVQIFFGWLFASAPSLSGIEHPFYDLSVIKCKSSK